MKAKFFLIATVAALAANAARADLSDPTRPYDGHRAAYVEPASLGPVLQSTKISALRRTAVISGRTVSVGDAIDGAVVADIRPYEVVLDRGGRQTILRMLPRLPKEKGKVE